MTQIKTYRSERKTEAQKIAEEERKRETAQIKADERRASLAAAADADIQKEAAKIVLEKEKKRVPPDTDSIKLHEEEKKAQREADEARLEGLVQEHKKGKRTFYAGMKMAFGAAMKDMERSQEAARLSVRLGVSNPITSGVMGVGEGSGMIQDQVRFVEAVCKR
ncbi:unnamed protein product, partial [marine sediment metagenome]